MPIVELTTASLLNIRIVNIVVIILGVIHYFTTIVLLEKPPTRLPWMMEVLVLFLFLYLMERLVREGENKLQRALGYVGSYTLVLVYSGSTLSYLFCNN